MQRNTVTTILEDLVETLEDGREGFKKAAEKLADDGYPDIAARMREFSDQRSRLSRELRDTALIEGVEIEENGSAAGALHRGWMALTDALTGDDPHAILAAAESGEDHAVKEYRKALERDDLDQLRPVIAAQAEHVQSAHDEVRALRDQTR